MALGIRCPDNIGHRLAGFIGFHIARRAFAEGRDIVGRDSLNACYDPALKQARLNLLRDHPRFLFVQTDLAGRAAFGGDPHAYIDVNMEGFANAPEGCRHNRCRLLYAWS
jgi:UDP-glucuronate 4-epimerase